MHVRVITLALLSASLLSPGGILAQTVSNRTTKAPGNQSSHVPIQLPTASAKALQAVAHVEGISEYRLPNGLRVLLAPDASKPTTTVNITYLVGSRHENYGETGMAHLLEHMLFKGTRRRDAQQISEAVEGVGGVLNARPPHHAFLSLDASMEYAAGARAVRRAVHAQFGFTVDPRKGKSVLEAIESLTRYESKWTNASLARALLARGLKEYAPAGFEQ